MPAGPLPCSLFDDPPRKQVLLLSCMDLRLLDNIVAFMNQLNLQNRYDQVIFAGAAMGTLRVQSSASPKGPLLPWKAVFFDHLATAIDKLHREIKDIIILEHLDCGAYKELHPDDAIRKSYAAQRDVSKLVKFHHFEAKALEKDIVAFCARRAKGANGTAWKDIRVHCLVMDLVGRVTDL